MKKLVLFIFLSFSFLANSQTDYSDRWEDFFSYNNVKDFIKVDEVIYAMADNAVFIYNTQTQGTNKLSSVQGLSGETTSAIHYNKTFDRLVIGYENGLIEVVDADGSITVSADIVGFNQTGSKRINDIYEHENKLYLSTPFALIEYDIDRVEFGDTFFIGQNSSEVNVNQTTVLNNTIYAATNTGIYFADVNNPNLIDFNNWQQISSTNTFKKITVFNNNIYTTLNTSLQRLDGNNTILIRDFLEPIRGFKSSNTHLSVSLTTYIVLYDININSIAQIDQTTDFSFILNTAYTENNDVYLGTTEFGVLKTTLGSLANFEEIHPDGPLNNAPFSIAVKEDNLWVVYGGYDVTFTPNKAEKGYSHFKEGEWINTRFNADFPVIDLNYITINPNDTQHVFISSMGSTRNVNSVSTGGLLEIKNDEVVNFYNHNNSPIQDILATNPAVVTIRVVGTIFDREGNLWITNILVDEKLKKLTPSGQWKGVNINDILTNGAPGLGEIVIDKSNSIWVATRRNGALIYNENGDRKRALITEPTKGSLPNANVRTIAVDASNRIWIGTLTGLALFNNAAGLFDADIYDAEPVIILDDGIPKKLLGEETINSIVVDGGDNKWFGTENAGALYTNPNGQTTLANFNSSNSPLPSNKILKIAVDDSTGKVYFATDKGIVVYNSNVSPFGDELGEVYAYPNPALNNHSTVTIDGRNGTHLPKGTNVKILDVAGNLVYETNVVEGQELQGGKVVWNKRNLAGNKVASGVYIVLLSNDDASETTTTKIAIVN
ncbi:hypothetical protein LPB136_11945 [Tenacibaculum todarodis]|uniref:PorZ N-terminal beta-propeller domain-containing protein n=1 Tax=Tenacibaculum todarodis TaxID=1850252 RepID=A0A1L3JN23_9FLAO|nr:two-component regulator propeller domain-containing protein [Tenacibaculum todarodis]APG66493.1 hypothetical protein LPB136_11945 [Tenacibaculum todarodis]